MITQRGIEVARVKADDSGAYSLKLPASEDVCEVMAWIDSTQTVRKEVLLKALATKPAPKRVGVEFSSFGPHYASLAGERVPAVRRAFAGRSESVERTRREPKHCDFVDSHIRHLNTARLFLIMKACT